MSNFRPGCCAAPYTGVEAAQATVWTRSTSPAGLLYDDWAPNAEEEGVMVFMQGYENRGQNNERKKIYVSVVTPDLIATRYRPKLVRFYKRLFADSNAGKPLMGCYFDNYYDLYWDLHVGATGDAIPKEVR